MNVKALVLTGVTTALAVVTLVALNLVAPITHADDTREAGITADQVFNASIAEPGEGAASGELEVAQAETSAPAPAAPVPSSEPATVAGGSCAMVAPVSSDGSPVVVAGNGAPVESSAAPAAEAAPMEVAQAETAPTPESSYNEPAAAAAATDSGSYDAAAPIDESSVGGAPAVAAGACSTGIADPSQPPVVVMASGVPGESSAPVSSDASAEGDAFAEPAPVATPEPAYEAPAPAPVAEAEPAPAAEPAPQPVAAAPAKPKAPVQKVPKVQPAETKLVWWPAKADGKLNITYAGSAAFTKAITLITDGAHADGSKANEHIKVTTKSGKAVPGQWLVANGNPQMLLYSVPPGIYKVSVGSGMTDKGNRSIAAESSGLVYVP